MLRSPRGRRRGSPDFDAGAVGSHRSRERRSIRWQRCCPRSQAMTIHFTTSWDDGHPLDLKMAAALSKHGFRGTFYLPCRNRAGLPVLSPGAIRAIAQEHEIASHTLDHCYLDRVTTATAQSQIADGRRMLEDWLGQPVHGFAYPGGRHSGQIRRLVREAAFSYARTVEGFSLQLKSGPFSHAYNDPAVPAPAWCLCSELCEVGPVADPHLWIAGGRQSSRFARAAFGHARSGGQARRCPTPLGPFPGRRGLWPLAGPRRLPQTGGRAGSARCSTDELLVATDPSIGSRRTANSCAFSSRDHHAAEVNRRRRKHLIDAQRHPARELER